MQQTESKQEYLLAKFPMEIFLYARGSLASRDLYEIADNMKPLAYRRGGVEMPYPHDY